MSKDPNRSVAGRRTDYLTGWSRMLFVVLVVFVVGIGAAACGGGGAPSSKQEPAPAATSSGAASTETVGGIPIYEPSTVVSKSSREGTFRSPDSVERVTAFYLDVVDKGDWKTISEAVTNHNASLTLGKSGKGASISIYPAGAAATGITISTYPS